MTDSGLGPDALPQGFDLHEYKIRGVLGRGGFSVTYVAEDIYLDHVVALKEYFPLSFAKRTGVMVSACVNDNSEKGRVFAWGLQRYIDEARILARCRHPNIVRVIRYFEANGTAYLVMDFETGEELGRYRDQLKRPFTEAEIMALMVPLMEGLSVVHSAGFLHRDIKPDNIVVRPDGAPVLLDFGAARQALGLHSALFTVIVTAGFAPIEQYSADGNQGPWTDVYGLGAVFYWAVTGEKPPDALVRMRRDPYQPVSHRLRGVYSERLLATIDIALMFDAPDRFQSMEDWLGALRGERPIPPTAAARLALLAVAASAPPPPARTIAPSAPAPRLNQPAKPGTVPGRERANQLAFDSWRKSVEHWSSPGVARPATTVARPATTVARPARPPTVAIAPTAADTLPPPKPANAAPVGGDGPVTMSLKQHTPAPRRPPPAPPRAEFAAPPPPATPSPLATLDRPACCTLAIRYGETTATILIGNRDYLIGRSSDNDLILTHPIASRHHAKIVHDGTTFQLIDASKFGTVIRYADGRVAELLKSKAPLTGIGAIGFGGPPTDTANTVTFRCMAETDTIVDNEF